MGLSVCLIPLELAQFICSYIYMYMCNVQKKSYHRNIIQENDSARRDFQPGEISSLDHWLISDET